MATSRRSARRLLVLGASGTLGGPLTQIAAGQGWDVTGSYFTRPERIRAGTSVRLDLRDRAAVRDLVETVRPDAIIHAAVTERSGPGYDEAIRLAGRHVAEAAAGPRDPADQRCPPTSCLMAPCPCYTEESDPLPGGGQPDLWRRKARRGARYAGDCTRRR